MSSLFHRAIVLALLLPCTVSAQALGARITAGGGMDAVLRDGSDYVPSYVGQVGLDWRMGTRGGLRLGFTHYQQNRSEHGEYICAGCTESRRFGATGLLLDGTFDLTRGRFRPYLLSGAGIYRSTMTSIGNFDCQGGCSVTGTERSYTQTAMTLGLHSGLGFSYALPRTTLFTETRITILGSDTRSYRAMVPLVFGIRF